MPYKDPKKELERQKRRRQTPEWKEYERRRRQTQKWKDAAAARSRKHLYGITREQYAEMLQQQDNRCKICLKSFGKVFVDHDHKTNKVRALLCPRCNTAVGYFEATPALPYRIELYLKGHL
jgi:recombination endonuclease VII